MANFINSVLDFINPIAKGSAVPQKRKPSKGERVIGSLFPSRGLGYPGGWTQDRLEQVMHFRSWVYVAIDSICNIVAQLPPNMAYVHHQMKGKGDKYTNKARADESLWRYRSISFGGHSFSAPSYYTKALGGVIRPHEELVPLEHNHPLRLLLEKPNPYDTMFDLLYELIMFLDLCGCAYLWAVPSGIIHPKTGQMIPKELWVIPSHWVWVHTGGGYNTPNTINDGRLIQYYEIRPWGGVGSAGTLFFPPEQVIPFGWKSPLTKIDGYSKLGAIDQWIDVEEAIGRSRWAQMINQARSELWIELGEGFEDQDNDRIARIEARFMEKYQGAENYGRPIIGPPGAKATPLTFSPNEMAYIGSEEQIRDQILSAFRVPAAAVGLVKEMTYGCLDKQTECLTSEGWKNYKDLTLNTRIACYDPDTKSIIYRNPSNINIKPYKGIMHKWEGQKFDSMMTPNHRAYIQKFNATKASKNRKVGGKFEITRPDEISDGIPFRVLSAAPATCDIPQSVTVEQFGGKYACKEEINPAMIDSSLWLEFIGYYISEGYTAKPKTKQNSYEVDICQRMDSPLAPKIQECLDRLPFARGWKKYQYGKNPICHWRCRDRGLHSHLIRHCGQGSYNKKIPDYVKAWPAADLRILLDALIAGDGRKPQIMKKSKTMYTLYTTVSKQLADDVMEISIKCGLSARIKVDKEGFYRVHISTRTTILTLPHQRTEVLYKGDVWCVTVPTGLFVTRRNGKSQITGNSILAALFQMCAFCVNPRLAMMGQRLTKHLCSKFSTEDDPIRLWWDDCSPPDPAQLNSDITIDHQCILPGQELQGRVIGGAKSWYNGEAIEFRTASGVSLSVTSNHPIMTMKGLTSASELRKGDNLLHYFGDDDRSVSGNYKQHTPTVVEQVFESLAIMDINRLGSQPRKVKCSAFDFHGEAKFFEGYIQVVGSYRKLLGNFESKIFNSIGYEEFIWSDPRQEFLFPLSYFDFVLEGFLDTGKKDPAPVSPSFALDRTYTTPSQFSGFGELLSGFCFAHGDLSCFGGIPDSYSGTFEFSPKPHMTNSQISSKPLDRNTRGVLLGEQFHIGCRFSHEFLRFGSGSDLDVPLNKLDFQCISTDSFFSGEFGNTFSRDIALDQIVEIRKFHYNGPVYDFESPLGYIIVQSVIIGNCGAITPNEIRALRGRKAYRHGGDDPLMPGPGGTIPLPINTGKDLTDLAKLIPMYGQDDKDEQEGLLGAGGNVAPPVGSNSTAGGAANANDLGLPPGFGDKGDVFDFGGDNGGADEKTPKNAGIEEPNGPPLKKRYTTRFSRKSWFEVGESLNGHTH